MARSDGSTVIDGQPPAKPLVNTGRLLRTRQDSALDPSLGERMDSLKMAVESIINGTEWPSESKDAAKALLNTIKSSPYVPNSTTNVSQDLREQYILILEDVCSRLKDASSKSGMQRWKDLQRIESLASSRRSKCTLLFQTCQDDVSKIVISINECLQKERKMEEGFEASGALPGPRVHLTVEGTGQTPAAPLNIQETAVEQGIPSTKLTSGAFPTQHPPSSSSEDRRYRSKNRADAFTAARTTFEVVEAMSGAIPVMGAYVSAAAKVGLTIMEMIQTMDRDDDLETRLASRTAELSMLLAKITKGPDANQGEGEGAVQLLSDLQKELQKMSAEAQEWESMGRFNQSFHSREHAEALEGFHRTIQRTLEEIQVLVDINARNIVIGHENRELIQKEKRRLLDRLGDGKYGARGNAVEEVTCLPETRMEILGRINTWMRESSTANRVLWIRGMAGRGKSTIASTVFHSWKYRASCAIFHFRRGQNTLNTRVVCALARQLGSSVVSEVRNAVLESVQENEDIADESLEEQFKALFVTSLAKLDNQNNPILMVVDALDECDDPTNAGDFVRLIDLYSAFLPANVKFLLTSRPEAHLIRVLEPRQWQSEDLDTASDVSTDLERFITHACSQIRDSDPDVPETWPSSEDVHQLVGMSQGLFQWARTAVMYVGGGSPMDRLPELLQRPWKWSGLDNLYQQTLSKAFESLKLDPERENLLHQVLGILVVVPYSVPLDVIVGLCGNNKIFEEMDQADISLFLQKDSLVDLNSLLFIPTSPKELIRLRHTSIHDLLVSEHQRKYIDIIQYHQQLASFCLDAMLGHLKENICNLSDISKSSSEVQAVVEREMSEAVLYCCRSWSIHLIEGIKWPISSNNASTIEVVFKRFSKEKIMCWLEVMSLVGETVDAIRMAKDVHQWLLQCPVKGSEFSSLATLWNDVQRFITTFSEPISFGPFHIYASALPHCPVDTEIWNLYGRHAKVRPLKGYQTSTWPSNLWARSTGAPVRTIALSPDGKLLASGSDDKTIRLWDPQTGAAVGEPLAGHSNWVRSVCFSPNGKLLASGSDDNTVRLWDLHTRTAAGEPLVGHSNYVKSLCFSPDGKRLASGSYDNTIQLWNPQTKTAIGEPLTGHSNLVTSMCFSPDGSLLASGSDDNTIRLWNPQTRAAVGKPLKRRCDSVTSVGFSPDGKHLMANYWGGGFAAWDTHTHQVHDPPPNLLSRSKLGFYNHWIRVFSSRLFWLPSPYWGDSECQIILSGKILVVLSNRHLSFFDVSQILEP